MRYRALPRAQAIALAGYLRHVDLSLHRATWISRGEVAQYFVERSAGLAQVIDHLAAMPQVPAAQPLSRWARTALRLCNCVRLNPLVDYSLLARARGALRDIADYLDEAAAPTDGRIYPLSYQLRLACFELYDVLCRSDLDRCGMPEHLHQNPILDHRVRPMRSIIGEGWPG
ncbi:hypothetical protein GLE_1343 [Lysobacter enzymogenes]|uniref:Uncharacterized protein n=1 Tax=Lysobacter enzymogenes TaxID=69 RepID=A0A0S2DDP1_LYSEN|nr:hypothetical protein [Lysobacter enzymogenes]ALN56700.1 hypothetical protein GLE_1343 [Lysobacter enzymogenes]QCW25474.1 hypothetical protein FE772_07150 [Lysobacter enzymogenes]